LRVAKSARSLREFGCERVTTPGWALACRLTLKSDEESPVVEGLDVANDGSQKAIQIGDFNFLTHVEIPAIFQNKAHSTK
jgi:hypothetical protein